MKHITIQQLSMKPDRYKAHFINSLSGFKSANLIGTINDQGQTNLAIFSSVIHMGASPALVGFITRPHSVSRHTLENIKQVKQYTINQVSEAFYTQAHQTSARYLREHNEFKETGLTESYIEGLRAPFVQQSQLKYALKLREIIPFSVNDTQFVIGEITDVICEEQVIKNDGYIDVESLNTVSVSGLDSYHLSTRLSRLSYAKSSSATLGIDIHGNPLEGGI